MNLDPIPAVAAYRPGRMPTAPAAWRGCRPLGGRVATPTRGRTPRMTRTSSLLRVHTIRRVGQKRRTIRMRTHPNHRNRYPHLRRHGIVGVGQHHWNWCLSHGWNTWPVPKGNSCAPSWQTRLLTCSPGQPPTPAPGRTPLTVARARGDKRHEHSSGRGRRQSGRESGGEPAPAGGSSSQPGERQPKRGRLWGRVARCGGGAGVGVLGFGGVAVRDTVGAAGR